MAGNFKIRLLITALLLLLQQGITAQGREVNLGRFLKHSKDATTAVAEALAYCKKMKSTKLIIPRGVYEFWPDRATEQYLFVSNNDGGLRRITFLLEGFRNFEISGNGSQFIFHGFVSPFVLKDCSNVRIHSLSIDWARTFHSEAKILKVDEAGMELAVSAAYPYKIVNHRLVFCDKENVIYPYNGLLEFDALKRETAYMAQDYWMNSDLPAKEIKPGYIKIFYEGLRGTPGNILTFTAAGRTSSAIVISDSRKIIVDTVILFHCGGMGVIAQRSEDIIVRRVKVTPAKGRVVSITADATHFVNCKGHITLSDCVFENQLDDATNIHGIYVRVEKKIAPSSVLLALKHPQQFGFDFIKPGVRMELVHSNSLLRYSTDEVKSVHRINSQYTIVEFKNALPDLLKAGDVAADMDVSPDVLITNCTIRANRARGILLGSRGKTIIKNNLFHNAGAAILFEGDGRHWYEQAGVRNVLIEGNIFENCNYGVWGNAVIQVGPGIDAASRKISFYNKGITIQNNIFKIFDSRIVNAYAVDKFIFRNNKIFKTTAYPPAFSGAERFKVTDCENVIIDPGTATDYNCTDR